MNTEIDIFRANAAIDPHLQIWGWEIPVYLFLGGMGAGIMILSALLTKKSRWAPFLPPLLLSIGMGALFLDLELKLHVFRFYTAFRVGSPMSWGSWILLAIYPATIGLGFARYGRYGLERHTELLEKLNVALGIALGAYTGILLGAMGARALWHSPILPILFLVSGFSTGAALLLLTPLSSEEHRKLVAWDLGAIVTELALIGLYLLGLDKRAAAILLGGDYTAAFWTLVIIAGLTVPLLIETLEWKGRARATAVAPALLLIGGFALRWILVSAGQTF